MISSKQKAKDLIKVAEKIMDIESITEMREVTRLLVKELQAIDEPILKGEDDDIINFSKKVDKWFDESYKRVLDDTNGNFDGYKARNITRLLKYLNQTKDDIDKLYKGNTTFTIKAKKFKQISRNGSVLYEYILKHNLHSKNVIYQIWDMEGDSIFNMSKVIDENTVSIINDEQCDLKVVFNKNKFSGE